jgi:hypothetical protein
MPEFSPQSIANPAQADLARGWHQRWRWAGYSLAALLLGLVFALYVQPDMMVTLAEQLWACF